MEAPSRTTDEARFELLGVLTTAHAFVSDQAAIDLVTHFARDMAATCSNSTAVAVDGLHITIRADVRAGCRMWKPNITIEGLMLADTVSGALEGSPLARLVGGWLAHPGLVIESAEPRTSGTGDGIRHVLVVKLQPTSLDADEAIAAIRDTASARGADPSAHASARR